MDLIRVRASALLLALLLLVAACTSTQTPGASPSSSPMGTPDPSASPSAPPSAAPSASPDEAVELAWERVQVPTLGENSAVFDVEAAGPGFVALASDGLTGSAVLTSPDGREWTAVPQPEWTHVGLAGMVEADGRLVAVGRDTTDVDTDIAMVWISDDGVEWRRAAGGPDLEGAQLIDVVETDDGFVAIGGYPTQDAAGAWTSPDGEIWTRAAPTDSFQHAFVWAVAEGGPGLVAVGWRRNDDPATGFDPAFWTSVDGTEWTLAPTPDGAAGAQARDVTRSGDTMVAVGDDVLTGGQAFAWVSTDGTSWETVDAPETFEGAALADVAATPDGFIALGGRNVGDGGVWLSSDGRAWTVVDEPVFADASLVESLAIGDDVILVGNTQEQIAGTQSYTWQPMIWYGSPRP